MCAYSHIHVASSRDTCYTRCIHIEITAQHMHKRCYTITLDIECWDDLPIHEVDWAKAINLFPDEYIHSSVKELGAVETCVGS